MNKYCTKVKLRAAIGGTQISYCQRITALKMFSMQCTKHAGRFFEKVLWLCLLLIDISGSPKILDNISVILSKKKV